MKIQMRSNFPEESCKGYEFYSQMSMYKLSEKSYYENLLVMSE